MENKPLGDPQFVRAVLQNMMEAARVSDDRIAALEAENKQLRAENMADMIGQEHRLGSQIEILEADLAYRQEEKALNLAAWEEEQKELVTKCNRLEELVRDAEPIISAAHCYTGVPDHRTMPCSRCSWLKLAKAELEGK